MTSGSRRESWESRSSRGKPVSRASPSTVSGPSACCSWFGVMGLLAPVPIHDLMISSKLPCLKRSTRPPSPSSVPDTSGFFSSVLPARSPGEHMRYDGANDGRPTARELRPERGYDHVADHVLEKGHGNRRPGVTHVKSGHQRCMRMAGSGGRIGGARTQRNFRRGQNCPA
jgi:hypothetical protein